MTVVKYFEDLENWEGERKSERETSRRGKEAIRKGKMGKQQNPPFLNFHL
jgi:hypothetical protein